MPLFRCLFVSALCPKSVFNSIIKFLLELKVVAAAAAAVVLQLIQR